MTHFWSAMVDLALPVKCVGCGEPATALCARCRLRCQQPPVRRVLADACGQLEVWGSMRYAGVARQVILEYKTIGDRALFGTLRAWAAQAVGVWALEAGRAGPLAVIPLHSGRATRTRAGCDVPRHLARHSVREMRRRGVDVVFADVLRTHASIEQKGLRAADRYYNARHAFRVRRRGDAYPESLLFDDVVTTGASLLGARRALSSAGFRVVGAAVVAAVSGQAGDAGRSPPGRGDSVGL